MGTLLLILATTLAMIWLVMTVGMYVHAFSIGREKSGVRDPDNVFEMIKGYYPGFKMLSRILEWVIHVLVWLIRILIFGAPWFISNTLFSLVLLYAIQSAINIPLLAWCDPNSKSCHDMRHHLGHVYHNPKLTKTGLAFDRTVIEERVDREMRARRARGEIQ